VKKLFSKEEKAAIIALINLNIARNNIADDQDICMVEHQISRLLGTEHGEQREAIEEMIRKALTK
jgi:hypothetical protein